MTADRDIYVLVDGDQYSDEWPEPAIDVLWATRCTREEAINRLVDEIGDAGRAFMQEHEPDESRTLIAHAGKLQIHRARTK